MRADIESRYDWIEQVTARSRGDGPSQGVTSSRSLSERVDAILIHKIWGLLIFAAVMSLLFMTIFWLAQPIMQWIQDGVQWTGGLVAAHLPKGPMRDLSTDGIFAGVGAVVAFVPQIGAPVHLPGDPGGQRIPRARGISDGSITQASRTARQIVHTAAEQFRLRYSRHHGDAHNREPQRSPGDDPDRALHGLQARLPVYTLLIATFFAARGPAVQAGIMLAVYAAGIFAAAGTAWIFRRTLLKGSTDAFIMELPEL